ncbi:MAG TPA: PAS domain S-box protein [Nitrospirota bacterium]
MDKELNKDARLRAEAAAMNQELMLAIKRQHELTEAAERLNAQVLQLEMAKRKRAEETFSASELRYRRLFESANDGILLLDAGKGTIYDVNPCLMEMLGYSREEMVGKELWDIGLIEDIQTAKSAFEELLEKDRARYENLPLRTRDGRIIEVEVISSVYEVNQTRVVQCNFRDITERKALEKELMLAIGRQHELTEASERLNAQLQLEMAARMRAKETLSASELRYRRLFESANDGILLLDAGKGTVYDLNPCLMEMLGYTREEIVGKELWEIGLIQDIETSKSVFEELLKKDQAHYENLPLKTSYGSIIEVEVLSSVYEVNETRVVQCNFRDIGERKALEKQKADFYAMVTHDIRSPLTVIAGYSEILKDKADKFDAETNEMVTAIVNSANKVYGLIENFLSISKVEAGKLVVSPAPTDIAALLRDACSEIEMALHEKNLDLKTQIDDGLPKATVDPKLIQRAVLNLLHNAVNYTPAPGTITLKSVLEGNDIIISVTDTGKGVPASERQDIFEKYYRSEKTAGVKGSGLGLAIVKAAAEAHGGRVEVESEVGKGSTFKLFIPVNLEMKKAA